MLLALYLHFYSEQEDEKSILRSYILINRGSLITSIYLKKHIVLINRPKLDANLTLEPYENCDHVFEQILNIVIIRRPNYHNSSGS